MRPIAALCRNGPGPPRKAHRTYTVCKRQAERLRKLLGVTAYDDLLWNTERL